jgi:hypothetical protein
MHIGACMYMWWEAYVIYACFLNQHRLSGLKKSFSSARSYLFSNALSRSSKFPIYIYIYGILGMYVVPPFLCAIPPAPSLQVQLAFSNDVDNHIERYWPRQWIYIYIYIYIYMNQYRWLLFLCIMSVFLVGVVVGPSVVPVQRRDWFCPIKIPTFSFVSVMSVSRPHPPRQCYDNVTINRFTWCRSIYIYKGKRFFVYNDKMTHVSISLCHASFCRARAHVWAIWTFCHSLFFTSVVANHFLYIHEMPSWLQEQHHVILIVFWSTKAP